jgi:hypothetical protein
MRWLKSNEPGMRLSVYNQLWELHAGFERVRSALRRLRRNGLFRASDLRRLEDWVEEARAATASYLTGAIEEAETTEAGRLFRLRLQRKRRED